MTFALPNRGARGSRSTLLGVLLTGALLAAVTTSRASADAGVRTVDPDEAARRSKVAVRVGSRVVTVAEIEDRIAEISPIQAKNFGATRDEIVKAFVDQVIVRDLVLGVGAEERHLDGESLTKHQLKRALGTATLRALRSTTKSPAAIPSEDVAKYYDENRSRFESTERVNLWRILCKSKDEADVVLAAAKRDLTIPKYNDLARDHSIDKATNFRGGNLGFVAADGASNEAGLKIDPTLVNAASGVKDGELVPQPVPEAGGFAVIWRRSTVAATRRSLEDASAQIRTTLFRERTEANEKKLIDDLRVAFVRDYDPAPLRIVVIPAPDAGIMLPRSIPSAKAHPASK